MRSSTFDKIIDKTLEFEDYNFRKHITIEDDSDDAGGVTILGLDTASHGESVRELAKLVRAGKNTEAIEMAKDIYYGSYYAHKDAKGLNLFDKILDIKSIAKIFDLCVNTGNAQAAKFVRRGLNKFGAKLPINGKFDDDVITAVNKYSTDDFVQSLKDQHELFILIINKFIECLDDISKMNVLELIGDVNALVNAFKDITIPKGLIDQDVVNAIIGEARDFYIQIAKKRNNKKYLKGWLRRADYIYKA